MRVMDDYALICNGSANYNNAYPALAKFRFFYIELPNTKG